MTPCRAMGCLVVDFFFGWSDVEEKGRNEGTMGISIIPSPIRETVVAFDPA